MSVQFGNRRKSMAEFSPAGLTDVVMLLLIFFLISSSFIPSSGIQVNLPQSDSAATTDDPYLNVSITEEGRFYVEQDEVSPDSLEALITARRGTREALVLRADEKATVGQFAQVATIARAMNMRVLMATEMDAD